MNVIKRGELLKMLEQPTTVQKRVPPLRCIEKE